MKTESEKQPFESHSELTDAIAQAACTWQVDMTTWNKLLSEINKVCSDNRQLQEENDRLKALVKELADIPSIDHNHQNLRLKAYRALNGHILPNPPQK